MNIKNIIIYISLVTMLNTACKKSDENIKSILSNILVVNTNVGIAGIKINITGKPIVYSASPQITYGTAAFYYTERATGAFNIVAATDTTKRLISDTFNLKSALYTIYLFGTATEIDTLFKEEVTFPFIKTDPGIIPSSADSVVNVRFVNLSIGSPALKIKISTSANNEIDNLPYKGIGEWKRYNSKLTTTVYSFQIRRVDNDALVTTYNFSATATNRFKSVSLVMRGIFGTTTGTTPFGVTPINYF